MRLGDLIKTLEGFDSTLPVRYSNGQAVGWCTSWRGRYDELTLCPLERGGPINVAALLNELRDAVGATFQGYKGGDYVMSERTPVWADDYGECTYYAILGARIETSSGGDQFVVLHRQSIQEYV